LGFHATGSHQPQSVSFQSFRRRIFRTFRVIIGALAEFGALMTDVQFETSDLDIALTKLGDGCSVRYTGPHQGIFRFESVTLLARKSFLASSGRPMPSLFGHQFAFADQCLADAFQIA
jgi:hypothetical protein